MSTLKALIFDVDGTLAETEDAHRQAFNEAFRRAGLDWHWDPELYGRLLAVAGGKERLVHYIDTHHPGALDSAAIAALHADKTRIFQERLASGAVPLKPGIARLFDQARAAGVRLAVATTTHQGNVETLIRANLGEAALGWFDAIGAAAAAERKKPAPDVYLWVLDQLNLKADECLAIEDSKNGVGAAVAARIPVVGVHSRYTADDDLTGTLWKFDCLGEDGANDAVTLTTLQDLHGIAGKAC